METYKMNIAGCERELPICKVNDNLSIAAFIMFGDVEVTVNSAKELLKIVPDFDVILTAEAKGIPLGYEMARQSNKPYVIARKSVKLYMNNVVSVKVKSITTDAVQTLCLDGAKAELLKGKKVLIVDDVISTGESLNSLKELTAKSGGEVVACSAVLAEGDAADRKDIIFLHKLPLFVK